MELENKKITLKVVVFTDKAVFSNTGKHLSNIESLVLQETFNGKKYPEIASENGYTIEYIKNDVGPKLWRRLSFTFGEKVNKSNVKIIITNRLYNEQEKPKSITSIPSILEQKKSLLPSATINASPLASKVKKLEKIADIYFETSLKSLRGTAAHKMLMVLIMFPHGAVKDAIIKITEVKNLQIFTESLTQLKDMLLIEEKEQRYGLNPAFKSYVIKELMSHTEFENISRNRWINWYLEIAKDPSVFHCEQERKNLVEVVDWCMNHNLYEQVKKLWPIIKYEQLQPLKEYESSLTQLLSS